jgi:hypothetical protein
MGGDESTSTLTLHPPAATAFCDGRRCCHPCLPPRRQSGRTLNPSATTTSRDRLRPCLPPRHRSTLRVNVNVASYHCHRHVISSSLSSSPSLSPPPFDVARPCCILPLPPPCTIIVPAAGQCQRRIPPPPPPLAIVFVPVFLPAAGQHRALTSTLHPTTATATRDLRHCCHPRPCPRHLWSLHVHVASSRRHRLAQSSSSLSSPSLSLSPPPVDVMR